MAMIRYKMLSVRNVGGSARNHIFASGTVEFIATLTGFWTDQWNIGRECWIRSLHLSIRSTKDNRNWMVLEKVKRRGKDKNRDKERKQERKEKCAMDRKQEQINTTIKCWRLSSSRKISVSFRKGKGGEREARQRPVSCVFCCSTNCYQNDKTCLNDFLIFWCYLSKTFADSLVSPKFFQIAFHLSLSLSVF